MAFNIYSDTLLFGIILFIFKHFFHTYNAQMKIIEYVYIGIVYGIILLIVNNVLNKPKNLLSYWLMTLCKVTTYVNPPEMVGTTNGNWQRVLIENDSKIDNNIGQMTDSRSLVSISINIGILTLLIFIWSLITIPIYPVVRIITFLLIIVFLICIPMQVPNDVILKKNF